MNTDRKILIGLGVIVAMCVVTVVVVLATLWVGTDTNSDVNSGRQTLAAQEQAQNVSSCRARFAVDLVSAPQARTVKAVALYGYGSAESTEAASKIQEDEYQALAALAETDVKAFLKRCDQTDGEAKGQRTCADYDAPIPKDDERYDPALDGDGDGIACE